ncbi:MAG: cytochrome c biogenesis protein ResB [Micrococcales bacterium]|nr:cytochrome c biogenesis protein ResB [Micrococcales bacterium]
MARRPAPGASAPADEISQPRLGPRGWARWAWRSLTSMRTALLLLLLLAVAALPGSVWPQRSIDAARTADYIAQHPTAGPILDRLGFFEVYASPWFAAIYLLLLVSLLGCVLPRSVQHWKAMRARPPRAPRRLERLSAHASEEVDATPEQVLEAARDALRRRRMRVHSHDDSSVSSEGGYARETGNLVFHIGLVVLIVGFAYGHLFGWKGDVIVPVGQTFANTLTRYDTFSPGPLVDTEELDPFTIRVDRLDARFEENVQAKGQLGMPRDFTAHVTTTASPGAPEKSGTIKVNHPLEMGKGTAFLLGNGYAPTVTVKDAKGTVLYREATPFLAQDNNYKSVGAIKVPGDGSSTRQLGFSGFFLPTATVDEATGPTSIFPDAKNPVLVLTLFEGDLFPEGRPQSVYTLDTAKLTQVKDAKGEPLRIWLEPGQTLQLPGGRGSITFDRVDRFAGLSIRDDPGKWVTLGASLASLLGLVGSVVINRRRVFVRVTPAIDAGRTVVTVGGLAKDDDASMPEVVTEVLAQITQKAGR